MTAPRTTRSGRSASGVTLSKFGTSRKRITTHGKQRSAAIISFRLSHPARLVLVLRGPGPDCDVAGRVPIVGRSGTNRVRFDGTIGNRRLDAGTYMLEAQTKRAHEPLARTYVTIDAAGARRTPRVLPQCTQVAAAWWTIAHAALAPLGSTFNGGNGVPGGNASYVEARGEVLGAQSPPQTTLILDLPGLDRLEGIPRFVAYLLFALLIGSLLGIVATTIHHLRQSRAA